MPPQLPARWTTLIPSQVSSTQSPYKRTYSFNIFINAFASAYTSIPLRISSFCNITSPSATHAPRHARSDQISGFALTYQARCEFPQRDVLFFFRLDCSTIDAPASVRFAQCYRWKWAFLTAAAFSLLQSEEEVGDGGRRSSPDAWRCG